MFGIFALATLAWILALVYYPYIPPSKERWKDIIGLKLAVILVLAATLEIFFISYISTLNAQHNSGDYQNTQSSITLSSIQWLVIGFLACSIFTFIFYELFLQVRIRLKNYPKLRIVSIVLSATILAALILIKVFRNNTTINNLFLFLIVLLMANFAVVLKRSAFGLLFGAIMLLDIYLVWMAGKPSDDAEGSGASWYVAMSGSLFVQHLPFPIYFKSGGYILGNGDVGFTCLLVMYAKRIWGTWPAIISGVVATIPLLILPYAEQIFSISTPAWPYTIFIAPVALFIAIFAPRPTKPAIYDGPVIYE